MNLGGGGGFATTAGGQYWVAGGGGEGGGGEGSGGGGGGGDGDGSGGGGNVGWLPQGSTQGHEPHLIDASGNSGTIFVSWRLSPLIIDASVVRIIMNKATAWIDGFIFHQFTFGAQVCEKERNTLIVRNRTHRTKATMCVYIDIYIMYILYIKFLLYIQLEQGASWHKWLSYTHCKVSKFQNKGYSQKLLNTFVEYRKMA